MSFSEQQIEDVWQKGQTVAGNSPAIWRKDQCDAWIRRTEYGNRNSQYGWEIDHISPGGSDELINLRPLQWRNNLDKSDERLKCHVKAAGERNVDHCPDR